jgi:lysophospholipase L1-like esterase
MMMIAALLAAQVIHSMDDLKVRQPKEKGRSEVVEGHAGKAVKFSFDDASSGQFCITNLRGNADWDKAAGFSFWVKGDGSKTLGGLQFIWNDDYAARYDYAFPIDSTEWRKISVPWRDVLPVLPGAPLLDPKGSHPPSKLSDLWFGKWWYWKTYPAHGYAIDDLRLEPTIELEPDPPVVAPRVLAKLKAGKPITIVTMGDSLTDYSHWANKPVNWPTLLTAKIKEKYKVDVKIVNPAIGGTQLRQGLILIPRWVAEAPEPDLVTICYGGNDWESGMRGPAFTESCRWAVERARRATRGKSDVILMTTAPALERWSTPELTDAVRAVAAERKTGLADIEKVFHAASAREPLFCRDKVHLGPVGHEAVAAAVLAAIEAR